MFALYRQEIRNHRWALLAYTGIALMFILMYTGLFPSIKAQAANYQQLFTTMPKGIMEAFGIDTSSFSALENFLAIELFSLTWPLLALLLANSRAGGALAGEVERGTLRSLLSLPISRAHLYCAKYLAGLSVVAIFVGLTTLGIIPIAALFGESVHVVKVLQLAGLSFLFTAAVYSAAFLASSFFADRGKVYMVTGGLLFTSYVLNIVSGLKDNLGWLKHYSIFHYYDATHLLGHGADSSTAIACLLFAAITFIAAILGYIRFTRRDIPSTS